MTSAPAIGFEYRSSRVVRRLLIFAGILVVLSVAMCALATWLKAASGGRVAGGGKDDPPHGEISGRGCRTGAPTTAGHCIWRRTKTCLQRLASFRVLGMFRIVAPETMEQGVQVWCWRRTTVMRTFDGACACGWPHCSRAKRWHGFDRLDLIRRQLHRCSAVSPNA
jgi:toxin CptA